MRRTRFFAVTVLAVTLSAGLTAVARYGGAYPYSVTIPLEGWPPGRYVLRIDARSLAADGPSVSRELEFRIE